MRTTQKEFPFLICPEIYHLLYHLKKLTIVKKNYEQKNKVCKGILFRSAANEQLCTPKNSLVSCGDKTLVR